MARLPRMVLPGIPHHITQRGNRGERTVFEDGDYALYLYASGVYRRHVALAWGMRPLSMGSHTPVSSGLRCWEVRRPESLIRKLLSNTSIL